MTKEIAYPQAHGVELFAWALAAVFLYFPMPVFFRCRMMIGWWTRVTACDSVIFFLICKKKFMIGPAS